MRIQTDFILNLLSYLLKKIIHGKPQKKYKATEGVTAI
jgi:hypothetical protein